MMNKLKDTDNSMSKKLHAALILRVQERRTDVSALLQYIRKVQRNVQVEVEIITVPSSLKYQKLYAELLKSFKSCCSTRITGV